MNNKEDKSEFPATAAVLLTSDIRQIYGNLTTGEIVRQMRRKSPGEISKLVSGALKKMTDQQRLVFVLYVQQTIDSPNNTDYPKIAREAQEVLGMTYRMSISQVRDRLRLARKNGAQYCYEQCEKQVAALAA